MAETEEVPVGARLRAMWIEDNLVRFLKAKNRRQIRTALNRAYDETVYHQIIIDMGKSNGVT